MASPAPGLEDVDQREPEEERNGRGDLEVDDRLQADAPHRLQVAGAGDADHQRREQQRRDDHLDHPEKGVGQRLDGDTKAGPEMADEDAEHEADEDLGRDGRQPPPRRRGVGVPLGPNHRTAPRFFCTKDATALTTYSCWSAESSP